MSVRCGVENCPSDICTKWCRDEHERNRKREKMLMRALTSICELAAMAGGGAPGHGPLSAIHDCAAAALDAANRKEAS